MGKCSLSSCGRCTRCACESVKLCMLFDLAIAVLFVQLNGLAYLRSAFDHGLLSKAC